MKEVVMFYQSYILPLNYVTCVSGFMYYSNTQPFRNRKRVSSLSNYHLFNPTNIKRLNRLFTIATRCPFSGYQEVVHETPPDYFRVQFQSTCHSSLDACRSHRGCDASLESVLVHCDNQRCNRNACMTSLQTFYRAPLEEDLSLDMAFCLCK